MPLTKGFFEESCLQNTLVKREALWQSLNSLFFCLYSQVECCQALVKKNAADLLACGDCGCEKNVVKREQQLALKAPCSVEFCATSLQSTCCTVVFGSRQSYLCQKGNYLCKALTKGKKTLTKGQQP